MTPNHYELTEEEFNFLLALARLYDRNARRCLENKAYVAGCAAAGAALETALIGMVHVHWHQIPGAFKPPTRRGQPKPLLDWNFDDLLRASHEAGWLSQSADFREAFDLSDPAPGDYASQLRLLRNLIHPQRYLRDHAGHRVTARMLKYAIELESALGARLGSIVEKHLTKALVEADEE